MTKERTRMNRYSKTMLAAAFAFVGCTAYAQTSNPLSTEVKGSYNNIKNNFTKAADKMTEENYAFKPTPEVQSWRERVAHIADANMRTCAAIKGEQKTVCAASQTTNA